MIVVAAASARGSHVVIAIGSALSVSTVMQCVCTCSSSTETGSCRSICVRMVAFGERRDMRRFNRRVTHSIARVSEKVDRVGSPISWIKLKRHQEWVSNTSQERVELTIFSSRAVALDLFLLLNKKNAAAASSASPPTPPTTPPTIAPVLDLLPDELPELPGRFVALLVLVRVREEDT